MSKECIITSKPKEAPKKAKIPLLSTQGYAQKGAEVKHQVSEISKMLSDYSKSSARPKVIYPFSSSRYKKLKILKRFRTIKFPRI